MYIHIHKSRWGAGGQVKSSGAEPKRAAEPIRAEPIRHGVRWGSRGPPGWGVFVVVGCLLCVLLMLFLLVVRMSRQVDGGAVGQVKSSGAEPKRAAEPIRAEPIRHGVRWGSLGPPGWGVFVVVGCLLCVFICF
jgi:uncharacterized membrane protein